MKKKIILIIIIVLCGLMLFFEKNNLMKLMQGIKFITQKINENDSKDMTIIDITGITPSPESQHEHIYKTHYDDTKHWEECTICSIKRNEVTHNFTTTWVLGYESCDPGNLYTKVCSCGYNENGKKPCVWSGKYQLSERCHLKTCDICGKGISNKPYYEENRLYYNEGGWESCTNSSRLINCTGIDSCTVCGSTWTVAYHTLEVNDKTKTINCTRCKEKFGEIEQTVTRDENSPGIYTFMDKVKFNDNVGEINELVGNYNAENAFESVEQKIIDKSSDGKEIIFLTTFKFNSQRKKVYYMIGEITCKVVINGVIHHIPISIDTYMFPDLVKPTISNVEVSGNEWTKSKPITITGTENYCSTVNVKIENDRGIVVYEGGANVIDNDWSVSCTPELEAGEAGRTFTVTVTDSCENSTMQEFTISKIDGRPPTVISSDNIGGTEWVKERVFTFTAEDLGVGNVQIGFNNVNDYSLAVRDGTDYSKEYKFVGDAYSPVQGSVYFKDELGNITTQVVTIDKVDNTAPTITKGSIHNNVLTLESHDRHSTLGEGSGVIKYRYIASKEKLENPEVSGEKSIEVNIGDKIVIENISQVKYIYVVAEDLVGNISESYEIKVPELVLTSRADNSLSEGKGGVILEWTGYDISDKYFVIYRKEESAEEFEVINNNFSGKIYTDITANDKAKPSVPQININKNIENNNIEITQSETDAGTKYTYYIEAHDKSTEKLIAISNIK